MISFPFICLVARVIYVLFLFMNMGYTISSITYVFILIIWDP